MSARQGSVRQRTKTGQTVEQLWVEVGSKAAGGHAVMDCKARGQPRSRGVQFRETLPPRPELARAQRVGMILCTLLLRRSSTSLIHVRLKSSLIHVRLKSSLIHVRLKSSLILVRLKSSVIHVRLKSSLKHLKTGTHG